MGTNSDNPARNMTVIIDSRAGRRIQRLASPVDLGESCASPNVVRNGTNIMTNSIANRLNALGIALPSPAAPAANYVAFVRSGSHLYISGQLPMGPDGIEYQGRCGDGVGIDDGAAAARLCAINVLAQAQAALGDLESIARLVKITGFVNSTADFGDQPKVVNGASDLFVDVLGERGRHARSAVGVVSLPFGVAVEVEAIFEIA